MREHELWQVEGGMIFHLKRIDYRTAR
jgi:hypothetical protein